MNIEAWNEFKIKVIKNAHPPKKDCKWFRLYKFLEEYGEMRTTMTLDDMELELQDCFFTLALMSQFVEVGSSDNRVNLSDMLLFTWGIQIANKKDDDNYAAFYYYMEAKLTCIKDLDKVLDRAYDRLVQASFIKDDK